MKKKLPAVILLLLAVSVCFGQSAEIGKIKNDLPLIHDSLRYVDALNRLAMLLYEKNVDSTFYYTSRARAIAVRHKYPKGEADAKNNLGVIYDMKGDLQLSLRYYNDAYNNYSELHDSANIVQATMNIALVYQELGKDAKAIHNLESAIAIGRDLKQDSIMSLVWYNYVLMYPGQIPKDSIPVYINRAGQIAAKYNDTRSLLAIEQLTGDYYIKTGRHNEGVSLLKRAAATALKNNLNYLSLDILIDLGDQFAPHDSAAAVGYYRQGLSITAANGYRVYKEVITKKLNDFYTAKKDTARAFYYSSQLLAMHDEQEKIDNNSGVDYIEYALKEEELGSAQTRSNYELSLLFLAGMVCIMTVLTIAVLWRNRKRLQRTASALRLQFKQAESTADALEVINNDYARLIKIVAHDLRNPISAISSIANVLESDETLSTDTGELVDLIKKSSENCLQLINELMKTDFDPEQNLKLTEINIAELFDQCVHLLSFRARDKNQQLVLNNEVQAIVLGDYEKLWRVMNNLVINAIKFSPDNSEINIFTTFDESRLTIVVADKGMGIPAELQKQVFDPFTSARRPGTQGEQPFGLGLYISKQIVKAHHGKLWLKSEPGKGTAFYVELPVKAKSVMF